MARFVNVSLFMLRRKINPAAEMSRKPADKDVSRTWVVLLIGALCGYK
jgi:hypothetical protein